MAGYMYNIPGHIFVHDFCFPHVAGLNEGEVGTVVDLSFFANIVRLLAIFNILHKTFDHCLLEVFCG